MKQLIAFVFVCFLNCSILAQIQVINKENSNKWELAPVKGLKKGMGRLNLNFQDGVSWSIDIYTAQNKFLTNRSIETYKLKYYDLAPGIYNLKINTVLIENIPIEEGKATTINTGILDIQSLDWELRGEDGKKFFTSGNRSTKLVLPVGKYQIIEGSLKRLVEVAGIQQVNPEVFVDDQYSYIMSPVTDQSDTALATKGRVLLDFPLEQQMGQTFEFTMRFYNAADQSNVHTCGYVGHCHGYLYLPDGNYIVKITWNSDYGDVYPMTPIIIENLPVRKGYETRIKAGYIGFETKGHFKLMNETQQTEYFGFTSKYNIRRILPVGKYFLDVSKLGKMPIEIKDGEVLKFSPIDSNFNNQPKFRIVPGTKELKQNKGRLICKFPNADTVNLAIKLPNQSSLIAVTHSKDTAIYLSPGNYELILGGIHVTIVIKAGKDTHLFFGYVTNTHQYKILFHTSPKAGSAFAYPYKTMPIPIGYYQDEGYYYIVKLEESQVIEF